LLVKTVPEAPIASLDTAPAPDPRIRSPAVVTVARGILEVSVGTPQTTAPALTISDWPLDPIPRRVTVELPVPRIRSPRVVTVDSGILAAAAVVFAPIEVVRAV
jgi:hypothetical protein